MTTCWVIGKSETVTGEIFYAVCREGDQVWRALELPGAFYKPIGRLYLDADDASTALGLAKAAATSDEGEGGKWALT